MTRTGRQIDFSRENRPQHNLRRLVFIYFSLDFSDPPLMKGLFHYIVLFRLSWSSTCRPSKLLIEYFSHQIPSHALCALRQSMRHCLGVFFTLMQSKSQLQSIQCGDSNFLLRYFRTPPSVILYFCNAYPCQKNFLEHPPRRQTTYSNLDFGYSR